MMTVDNFEIDASFLMKVIFYSRDLALEGLYLLIIILNDELSHGSHVDAFGTLFRAITIPH
jgi:hypothetical protein